MRCFKKGKDWDDGQWEDSVRAALSKREAEEWEDFLALEEATGVSEATPDLDKKIQEMVCDHQKKDAMSERAVVRDRKRSARVSYRFGVSGTTFSVAIAAVVVLFVGLAVFLIPQSREQILTFMHRDAIGVATENSAEDSSHPASSLPEGVLSEETNVLSTKQTEVLVDPEVSETTMALPHTENVIYVYGESARSAIFSTLEALVAEAECIVTGEVIASETIFRNTMLYTLQTFRVEASPSGDFVAGDEILIVEMGGRTTQGDYDKNTDFSPKSFDIGSQNSSPDTIIVEGVDG